MKKLILLIVSVAFTLGLFSQEDQTDKGNAPEFVKQKLSNALLSGGNTLGRKFVIAFPMNEVPTHPTQALDVYIASSEEAIVRMYNDLTGFDQTILVKPGQIATLSSADGVLDWSFENRVNDEVVQRGFTIVSDKPVAMYVMNSKSVSTEGYLAIPVAAWGKEYRHLSYYDFDEAREWASGFIVIASEDKTVVDIELQGRGEWIAAEGGKRLGDGFTITMDEGECYMLKGTGQTRGEFDMSGSLISADKPVGLISFHQRTMIPAQVVRNGRDHLSAMMPPTQSWGTKYTTVELDRGTDKGDFFRVMAKEDDTEVVVRWYDKQSKVQLGNWDFVIDDAGDFQEYHPIAAGSCPGEGGNIFESIRGVSVFKSIKRVDGEEVENKDKPIFVMQYSYSACWDDAGGNYDPFMFPVSTTQQFTKSTIFMTPSNKSGNDYTQNFLNLIIQGDPNDADRNVELLRSVKFDGTPIADIRPSLLGNEFEDGLYWVTLRPEIGPHTLEGDAEFGGYIYGFANFDSYGWPAATAYANLEVQDTLPPVLEIENECYTYNIRATEFRDEEAAPDEDGNLIPQIDTHIDRDPVILSNNNFRVYEDENGNQKAFTIDPELETEDWYLIPGGDDDLNIIMEVDDPTQDAKIVFEIFDRAGNPKTKGPNSVVDSLVYIADKISSDGLDFGLVRISQNKEMNLVLTSEADKEIEILDLGLDRVESDAFRIADDAPELPILLGPGETVEIPIIYTPTQEWLDARAYEDGQYDKDSLYLSSECVEWKFEMRGQGGENYMNVTDWKEENPILQNTLIESNNNVLISNWNKAEGRPATWPLDITGIDLDQITDDAGAPSDLDPFLVINGRAHSIDADGNFVNGELNIGYLEPGNPQEGLTENDFRVTFETGGFESAVDGRFIRNVPFLSNAKIYEGDVADDTDSEWDARVLSSGVDITDESWTKTRLEMAVQGKNSVENNGYLILRVFSDSDELEAAVQLTELQFVQRSGDNGVEKWISQDEFTGEFEILQDDPNDPEWSRHVQNLTDGNTGAGIRIAPPQFEGDLPGNVPYRGEVRIPVRFTPKDRDIYQDNDPIFNTQEIEIVADLITPDGPSQVTATLQGEAYMPRLEGDNDELTQGEAVLAGQIFEERLLEIEITNSGLNSELYVYEIQNSQNIDWENDGSGEPFTFMAADSDFDPRDPAMNLANPHIIPVGQTDVLRFQFNPAENEDPGELTASFDLLNNGDLNNGANNPGEEIEPQENPNRDGANTDNYSLAGFVKGVGLNAGGTSFNALIECDESPIQYITFTNSGSEPFRIDDITDLAGGDIGTIYPWYVFYDETEDNIVDITYYEGFDVPADGILEVPVQFVPANANGVHPLPNITVEYTGNFYDNTGDIEERTQSDIELTADYFSGKLDFQINSIAATQRLAGLEIFNNDGQNLGIRLLDYDDNYDPYDEGFDDLRVNSIEFTVVFRNDQLYQLEDQDGIPEFETTNILNGWTVEAEKLPLTDSTVNRCWSDGTLDVKISRVRYTLTAPAGEWIDQSGDLIYPRYQVTISECPEIVTYMENISFGTLNECVASSSTEGDLNTEECIDEYRAVNPNLGPEYNSEVEVTTSSVKIKYDIGISHNTKIEVVDNQGNVVATPVNGYVEMGNHEVEVSLDKLSSGMHFVRIESLDWNESKKVMIVK